MPNSRKQPNPSEVRDDLALMQYLAECGVDPAFYVQARMMEMAGCELAGHQLTQLFFQARRNAAARMHWRPPPVESGIRIWFGDAAIPMDRLGLNTLVSGAVGSGKTNAELVIIAQLLEAGCHVRWWDGKSEARRLPLIFPAAAVYTPTTAPWQMFQPPPGVDPMTFGVGVITELRIAGELRAETYPLLYSIWERIVRGQRPGDPWPSLSDFRRVIHDEADQTHRENLYSVVRMLLSLEILMGANSRVRYVPKGEQRHPLEAIDLVGQDPRTTRLLMGLQLNELILSAQAEEHSTSLRRLEVIDEIAPLASIEVTRSLYGDLNGLQRFATLARFTGTGLIMGCQNISQIDPFVKNVGTFIAFRQPSYKDAVEAGHMLGLHLDATEQLMRLPVGAAYVRSVGWELPVLVQFPEI